ncbi:response regulator transcription factor [Glaciecola sp. XM2]|jgi:two-component system response regulator PhoP|uniref:response regulator transcription factor n=1 Tax=Glaciecola sp. XM2 TaxID=1914931 RepID=UPI001BDEC388|nr:response regulator transcription factor [Glaciecola sp. XM2]MBT1451724.1 response regulator transcription factor [Glaciecola sp. XM2]
MRLLLVEDDAKLNAQLYAFLNAAGYAVDTTFDGEEGLYQAQEFTYDAAIIDLGLPKLDGLSLIEKMRESITIPILILTARDKWQDKVNGLNQGADDYLTKPFQKEELLARVKALIRRNVGQTNPRLSFDELCIDTNAAEVFINQEQVSLTAYEYRVLEYLARHPNKIISKAKLTEHLYEQDFDRDSNVIEVFVKRLRKKISPEQSERYIKTVRGQGYKFSS